MGQVELHFSGENRQRALSQLIAQYDAVASSVPRWNTDPPCARVVQIHAERGLGKTRLAIELYRHLASEAVDQEGYWSELGGRDSVELMPVRERCNFNARMPFLWWGMAIPDGTAPGNTVLASLDQAFPHFVAMRLARRRDESSHTIGQEIAEVSFELADPAIDLAGEAVGISTLIRVGQAILKIGKTVSDRRQPVGLPDEAHDERLDSVIDSVLKDLDDLLRPSSLYCAQRPAVIFVDDAQFADQDLATAKFLESVIARMTVRRWPVLLVLTHWDRDRHNRQDKDGKPIGRSVVTRILEHARHRAKSELGEYAGEQGGTLSDDRYVEIDLSDPVDDLSTPIRKAYPLLGEQAIDGIAQRTGGNPRKLEQILAEMESHPDWFTDPRTCQTLTEEGLSEVLKLATLEIDEIAFKRFRETPPSVRRALSIASIVGHQFLVQFVERLHAAHTHDDGETREALETAERIYRFVRDVSDQEENDIGQFAERLFNESACRYRKRRLTERELDNWPGDEMLDAALDTLLDDLVVTPEHFGELSDADRAFGYALAAERMTTRKHPVAGFALARLVVAENERGNFEGATDAARRFVAGLEP